jgi:hypothetical protein
MSAFFKYGSFIWTASGAGWLVLGVVTGLVEAYVVGLGCCACAGLWLIVGEAIGGDTPEGGNSK